MKSIVAAFVLTTVIGCGLGDKAEQIKQMAEAAQEKLEAGDSAGALGAFLGGGESVQPVDFRDLKELLPEKLDGMARTNASGEKSSMMGIGTSKAEGKYQPEDKNGGIDITILDFGSMRGITMMGFGWTMIDIDNESENGYEKTMKYEGYPAYVKYEQGSDWSRGQMSVVVVDRFVVTANGNNVSAGAIKAALKKVDLGRLEDMKDSGVGEAPPERPDMADFKAPALPAAKERDATGESDQPQTVGDMLNQMSGGKVDPIDFRELKEMLPAELPGMQRTNAEGEKGGTMGITQSSAKGTYQPEGDNRTKVTIQIKDLGNLRGGAMMGGYAWLMMQTDKESDTGFERTTTYAGFPAFESYSTRNRPQGKIQVVIAQRFAVEVDG
ncbi:MAG: hypothetical protein WBW88_09125, partial [Rhodothermales bacterium]